MKRTIHMETTKVSTTKTLGEIQEVLRKHGMRRFNLMYEDGEVNAVHFTLILQIPGQVDLHHEMPYKLPADHKALLTLAGRGETRYLKKDDIEQARRVAWRQVLRWVEAQFAMAELEMVRPEQIFLPYMIVDEEENTVFDKMQSTGFQGYLLGEGKQ